MRTRSVEAFFACAMLGFGLIFLIPGRTLDLPGWGFVREWVEFFPGTEYRMGAILILVGTIRIAALIVNGHWYPTPAARLFGCMVGCLWWTTCATSFLLAVNTAGAFPTQIAWTFTAIVFEVFSAARAAADMHVMDTLGLREAKARRDGSGAG